MGNTKKHNSLEREDEDSLRNAQHNLFERKWGPEQGTRVITENISF